MSEFRILKSLRVEFKVRAVGLASTVCWSSQKAFALSHSAPVFSSGKSTHFSVAALGERTQLKKFLHSDVLHEVKLVLCVVMIHGPEFRDTSSSLSPPLPLCRMLSCFIFSFHSICSALLILIISERLTPQAQHTLFADAACCAWVCVSVCVVDLGFSGRVELSTAIS